MTLYFGIIICCLLAYTTSWFVYSQIVGRLDVADEAWGLAQPFIIVVAMLATNNFSLGAGILMVLSTAWGVRLFYHLHQRHSRNAGDDRRYVEMKAGWNTFPRLQAYVYVFLLQGFLMFLLGMSTTLFVYARPTLNVVSLVGVALWVFGYVFETVADRQLKSFVINPGNKDRIMDQGLWKYSRHPNYFGEVLMWWGIFAFVYINIGSLWALITPLTITYLIVFVSGIPLTERHFESNPRWGAYKKRTSALIPLPNRK